MAMPDEATAVARIKEVEAYTKAFAEAFPDAKDPVTYNNIAEAIAAFERTLKTNDRFDDFLKGDDKALTETERRGLLTVLNTIGAWILTSCACLREHGGDRGREDSGERGGLGVSRCESTGGMVQLVHAASLAATALFVGVERRHLMVSFPTSSPACFLTFFGGYLHRINFFCMDLRFQSQVQNCRWGICGSGSCFICCCILVSLSYIFVHGIFNQ
jgi:hypothetical protein